VRARRDRSEATGKYVKYISDSKRGWDHCPYWEYLESVKGVMPVHLFEFASNPENHDLTSPNSLHDSWLEYWRIAEIAKEDRHSGRRSQIEACFLGPMHDRHIYMQYKDVEKHSITAGYDRAMQHGDLLVHELAIVREGLFSHELVFAQGMVFLVHFADFEHRIELMAKQA